MKLIVTIAHAFTVAALFTGTACTAFIPPHPVTHLSTAAFSSNTNDQPKLVSQASYINAIDVLKQDMGIEIIPESEKPMYAIGKLVAKLPLEMVSGVRLADCDTLTLISQLQTRVVDATGIQSLDTIVTIKAGDGYEEDVCEKSIAETAEAYTAAINYAVEHKLSEIELEVNRLVPMMPSEEESAQ